MSFTFRNHPWPRWAAWGFWLLCFLGIMVDVVHKPEAHTTMPTYRFASTQWWRGQDPYTFDHREVSPPAPATHNPWWMQKHDDFLYFPQAAVLFTPFNAMPFFVGEFFWRAFTFGIFAYAMVRLSQFFLPVDKTGTTFLFLSVLAVPSSLASLRNSQFDLPLAALTILSAAEIASSRWTPAAAWLCAALALKPLAVVPYLLFGSLYQKIIPRLIIGTLIVLAIPFLHWNPAFAAHEYLRCVQALGWASAGGAPKFSDLGALFAHFGYDVPNSLKTAARIFFALVFLGLCWVGSRRLTTPMTAWLIAALSADYLMLFNPRTETCSYVFLGPFVASLALLYAQTPGRKPLAWLLGIAALGLACDGIPRLGGISVHDMTDRWFKPLLALFFLPVLVEFIFAGRRQAVKES